MVRKTRQTAANIARGNAIANQYKSGMTLEEVGVLHGITRERVRQIVAKLGIDRVDGGGAIRGFLSTPRKVDAAKTKSDRTEAICFKRWGMSMDSYVAHVEMHGNSANKSSPMAKYVQQRKNAQARGLEWSFTFTSWWSAWLDSGKWDQRGLGKDLYVMARYGDGDGAYCVENVYICTQSQNSKDSFIVSPAAIRFANCPQKQIGNGVGYCHQPQSSKKNPYVVQCGGRYVGSYPTKEIARDVYLKVASGEIKLAPVGSVSKLNADQVLKIRIDTRTAQKIAEEYSVSRAAIYSIKHKRSWAHI